MLKELPAEVIWKLIEGVPDEITPAAKEMMEKQRNATCPDCGRSLKIELNRLVPFGDNKLPRMVGICPLCGIRIDISSGLII